MPAISEHERSSAFDDVSPLLTAAAMAALAVSASEWAVGGIAVERATVPTLIAALAGLSAILGRARLPFLVRVALHLGAFWILQQYLGAGREEAPTSGLFFVSTAAFFGGTAIAGLAARRRAEEREGQSLGTGDLIAALFAFSAYVAVGQHAAGFWNLQSMYVAEFALVYVLPPYAALILLETFFGRAVASVSLCLTAVVAAILFPELSLIDPFAAVLIVALRIVGQPLEAADPESPPRLQDLRTPVPPAA